MPEVTSAPAVEAPAAPVVTTPEVTATPETPEVKPERTFSQTELNEAIEKRLSKERRKRADLETRARVAEELALKLRGEPQPQPQKQAEQGEPKREQFDSYEAYVEARAEYRADKAVERRLQEREEKESRTRAENEHRSKSEEARKRIKETAKGIEDFEEVMSTLTAEHPAARLHGDAIMTADSPGKLLHHLIKNHEEAERIASLSLVQQAREIVLLEVKLNATPAKSPSKAPAPISPVGGKPAPGDAPSDTDSMEDWIKKERARARKK